MQVFLIIFSIIYVITLVFYFFSETSDSKKRRAINKSILAALFYGLFSYGFFTSMNPLSYEILFFLGITFCFLGDLVLLKSFTQGGISFMAGNFLIASYLITNAITNDVNPLYMIIGFIAFLIVISVFAVLAKKKIINLRNMFVPIIIYVWSVTLHGFLSISLAAYYHTLAAIVLSIGLVLYMISDYFLMTYKFKYPWKKWILRCNSGTYFIGMLLVSISYFI